MNSSWYKPWRWFRGEPKPKTNGYFTLGNWSVGTLQGDAEIYYEDQALAPIKQVSVYIRGDGTFGVMLHRKGDK